VPQARYLDRSTCHSPALSVSRRSRLRAPGPRPGPASPESSVPTRQDRKQAWSPERSTTAAGECH